MAGEREWRVTAEHSTLPYRLEQVEAHMKEQRELNAKLNEGLWAIRSALELGLKSLSDRVSEHDKAKAGRDKFAQSVWAAVAIAAIMAAAKVASIVQGSHLPVAP
jgi:hypothetical protein